MLYNYTQIFNSLNLHENPFYNTFIDFYENGDGYLYIEIPNIINDLNVCKISNIKVLGGSYEIIYNKNILNNKNEIDIGKNKVFIRVFDMDNYQKVQIQFDIFISLYSSL